MIPLSQYAFEVDRSVTTLANWRRKGAPGFKRVNGRVYVDPAKVDAWRKDTQASRPGPKGMALYQAPELNI